MHPNEHRVGGFETTWICRAEGTSKDGKKIYSDAAISHYGLKRAVDEKGYRQAAERQVLCHFFFTYDQVPYRIYWVRDGREWLEAIPTDLCCLRDIGEDNPQLEINLRDTRDHTCDREDQ